MVYGMQIIMIRVWSPMIRAARGIREVFQWMPQQESRLKPRLEVVFTSLLPVMFVTNSSTWSLSYTELPWRIMPVTMRPKDQLPPQEQRQTSNQSWSHCGCRSSLLSPCDRRSPVLGYLIRLSRGTLFDGTSLIPLVCQDLQPSRPTRFDWHVQVCYIISKVGGV